MSVSIIRFPGIPYYPFPTAQGWGPLPHLLTQGLRGYTYKSLLYAYKSLLYPYKSLHISHISPQKDPFDLPIVHHSSIGFTYQQESQR